MDRDRARIGSPYPLAPRAVALRLTACRNERKHWEPFLARIGSCPRRLGWDPRSRLTRAMRHARRCLTLRIDCWDGRFAIASGASAPPPLPASARPPARPWPVLPGLPLPRDRRCAPAPPGPLSAQDVGRRHLAAELVQQLIDAEAHLGGRRPFQRLAERARGRLADPAPVPPTPSRAPRSRRRRDP